MFELDAQRSLRSTPETGLPFHSVRSPASAPHKHRSLKDALHAVGASPPIVKARGLLHRWFSRESTFLTVINTVFSLLLFALALTMTYFGMRLAQSLGLVVTLNETANAISPYAGIAFLTLGTLRFVQHLLTRNGAVMRFLGFTEASLLLFAGVWAEAVAWYTGAIPDMFKPQLALAGGAITANIVFFSTVIVPFFKPAMAAGLGGLLTAKQIKTTAVSPGRARWYVALVGLLASGCALVIGMNAGQQHLIGRADPHNFARETKADQWAKEFAPPFTAGTWCRVSDMFGPRVNPFWGKPRPAADGDTAAPAAAEGGPAMPAAPAKPVYSGPRIENHPGVDLAVHEGTPVYAMANGRIVYAGFDGGFGNMVALRTAASRLGQTTVLNGHMQALNVQSGQDVRKGTLIGWVGSTGRSTGPHLHVQVCPQGQAVGGSFRCGAPENPYEVWATLSAISRLACRQGPVGF